MTTTVTERYMLARTPVEVFVRLCEPRVVEARAALDQSLETRVLAHEVDGDVVRIRSRARLPLEWLPIVALARGAIGPVFERHEVWTRDGDELSGTAAYVSAQTDSEAAGETRLLTGGQGSFLVDRFTLTIASVALGRLVEPALVRRALALTRREAELLDA